MEKKINRYKIRIGNILLKDDEEPDKLIIESTDGLTFESKVIMGSVNFRIYNEDNKEKNLSNIQEGEIVTIYGLEKNKELFLKKEVNLGDDKLDKTLIKKNNIIIKKIIIKNKYDFNMESSEEITDSE